MSSEPTLAPDATIVLGIASTAMPFARTSADEAERWLRVLRSHGEAGAVLQALGVSDGALAEREEDAREEHPHAEHEPVGSRSGEDRDPVADVAGDAARVAHERGASTITTADVLVAVMHVYGEDFNHVLHAHGTERAEVLELLGAARAAT